MCKAQLCSGSPFSPHVVPRNPPAFCAQKKRCAGGMLISTAHVNTRAGFAIEPYYSCHSRCATLAPRRGMQVAQCSGGTVFFRTSRRCSARLQRLPEPFRPSATARPLERRHVSTTVLAASAAATDSIGAVLEALTPHSGYHYDGRTGRFFEGWYFKV